MYLDINYLQNFADFTVDKTTYGNIADLAKNLHDANKHLVVIIDAGISADDT